MDGRERTCAGLEAGAHINRRSAGWLVVLLTILMVAPSAVRAAAINYGNSAVIPPGVTFLSVTESSGTDPVPLYGPPAYYTTGMNFTPTGFVASATGGASDVTDGQLNFTISGSPSVGISGLNLFEAGDYTLTGAGTAATQALSGAIIRVTVTEIDGVPVAPINLAPVNGSVGFNLLANPGVVQPWSLGLGFNISSQLSPGFVVGATKVEVAINNQLLALSESGTVAFIAKKEFQLGVDTVVPEPTGVSLTVLVGAAALSTRRRRRMLVVNEG